MLDLFGLHGRVAIVTGAARGLGAALAVALAEAGADIVAIDVGDLADVAARIRATRGSLREHAADLSRLTPERATGLISRSQDQFGTASILVNNAGIIRRGPAMETPPQTGRGPGSEPDDPVLLSQAFAGRARAAGTPGSVINIGSVNSFQGGCEVPSYAASKHGLLGMTRALANEWATDRIRVNAIAPGYMETELTAAHREDPAKAENMLRRIPIGHWGTPADLAGAAVYLASDASSYVTGTALSVDGGWLSR